MNFYASTDAYLLVLVGLADAGDVLESRLLQARPSLKLLQAIYTLQHVRVELVGLAALARYYHEGVLERRADPLVRVALQEALGEVEQIGREALPDGGLEERFGIENEALDLVGEARVEGELAYDHLVEEHAGTPEVGAVVVGLLEDFWRHVVGRPDGLGEREGSLASGGAR